MADSIKLYDLRDCDFPVDREFRTLQVFKCHVCGALSNLAWWSSSRWGGARNECPNDEQDWHRELDSKRDLLTEPHPKSYKKELRQEIDDLLSKVEVRNDLEGEPDCGYEAQAVLNDGFVVDGIGIRADGSMRFAGSISKVFPPFEETVFAGFSKDLPADIASDLRARIPVQHRLRVALDEARNGDPDAAKRLEEEGNHLVDLSCHKDDPKRDQRIGLLVIDYGFAYEHWRAEQRLAEAREKRSSSLGA
jgi:hypothetical protein